MVQQIKVYYLSLSVPGGTVEKGSHGWWILLYFNNDVTVTELKDPNGVDVNAGLLDTSTTQGEKILVLGLGET